MSSIASTTAVEAPLARHIRTIIDRSRACRPAQWSSTAFEHSTVKYLYDRVFGVGLSHLGVFDAVSLDDPGTADAMRKAQDLTAQAFGATRSFFVTCGTTMANQVAFDSVIGRGYRVLLDRTAHQSMHCAALRKPCELTYAPVLIDSEYPGSVLPDVAAMLDILEAAHRDGRPFDIVAICASSYDGVTYDLPRVLDACLDRSPNLTFVVDEAWAAINNFHSDLRRFTALAAAEFLATKYGTPPPMLVTHSAHKSMAAARQGSYLHVVGDDRLVARVEATVLAYRPASVSLPILVSLDLARAHAEADGKFLVDRALQLREQFCTALLGDPFLSAYGILELGSSDPSAFRYLAVDPLKVIVDTTRLGLRSDQVKSILFRDYDIYISRNFGPGFLVTFHIGITAKDCGRLCRALASIARRAGMLKRREIQRAIDHEDHHRSSLLIAYPPGVPIALPGESDSARVRQQIEFYRTAGADIYSIPAGH